MYRPYLFIPTITDEDAEYVEDDIIDYNLDDSFDNMMDTDWDEEEGNWIDLMDPEYDNVYDSLQAEYEEIDRLFGEENNESQEEEDTHEFEEGLRIVLHENYKDANSEELREALDNILSTLTPMEGFNFKNILKQIGKAGKSVLKNPIVGQIAKTALPIAGTAVGTIFGGPVGAAFGGKLGAMAGQAFKGNTKPPASPKPVLQKAPQAGSTASAQLLQLTQNPNMLKSLASLALGSLGNSTVNIGQSGQKLPVGAFINLLSQLSNQAASDAETLIKEDEQVSSYLQDSDGNYTVDTSNPVERANALYELLRYTEDAEAILEVASDRTWENFFPFPEKTKLLIYYDYIRWWKVGKGLVLQRTPTVLEFKLHIAEIDKWGIYVPETKATIKIVYKNEGMGNQIHGDVNYVNIDDENVKIYSKGNSRQIDTKITIMDKKADRITFTKEDTDEAILTFKVGKDKHVFKLSD